MRGVFWSAVEKYSGIFIALLVSAVLARLISPKEFGTVAIVTVIINFLSIFATMGIFPAIIQRNDLTQKNLNSIFTYSLLGGGVLAILLFCFSWSIAEYYKDDLLASICQILSINIFFVALNLVPNALMAKNKRFKQIAKRTLLLQMISGIVSVMVAFKGGGVYALLISPIVTSIGMFLINMHYYPCRFDFTFDISPLRKIFSYSAFQFLFEFINYFSRNVDKLIIGKYLNLEALGYYDKSYRLMMLPLQNVTSVINPVMQPVLSCLQDDKRELAQKYNRIIQYISVISFPLAAFLYFTAYELINIIYGNQWNAAIPTFQILSLSLPLQMIFSTSGAIFQVSNSTKNMFLVGLRNTCITVLGFWISANFWGTIESIAWAWDVTLLINFLLSYYTLYHQILESKLSSVFYILKYPFIVTLVLSVVFYGMQCFLHFENCFIILLFNGGVLLIAVLLVMHLTGLYNINAVYCNLKKRNLHGNFK